MRRLLRAGTTTVALLGGAVVAAGPAHAAAHHVGVVVRYADGRVSATCTATGGSGLAVLQRTHSVTLGSQQYTGFVLQIDGVGTTHPDNTHYWSYWRSGGRGGWSYSSSGAASSIPTAGTVEGWSYVDGRSNADKPPSYTYAALCGRLDGRPAASPRGHRPAARQVAPAGRSTPSRPALSSSAPSSSALSSSAPSSSAPSGSAPSGSAPSNSASATGSSGGAPWPAVVALLVVAALGGTGWLALRRRGG